MEDLDYAVLSDESYLSAPFLRLAIFGYEGITIVKEVCESSRPLFIARWSRVVVWKDITMMVQQ